MRANKSLRDRLDDLSRTPVQGTPNRQQPQPTTGLFGIGKSNNIFGTPFTTSAQQNSQMPGVNNQYTTSGLMSNAQPQQQQARRPALDMLTNLRDLLQDGVTQQLPQPQQMPQQPQSQYPYVPQQQISMNPSNNVNPTMSFTNQNGTINVNPTISCSPQVSSNPQFGGMPQMAQTNGFDTSVVNQATPQMASNGMARQNIPTCEQQRHATQQRKQRNATQQAPQQGSNMFSTNGKGLFSSPCIFKDNPVIEPKPEVGSTQWPINETGIKMLLSGATPPFTFVTQVVQQFMTLQVPVIHDVQGSRIDMIICGSLFGNLNAIRNVLSSNLDKIIRGNCGIAFLGNYTGFGENGLNVILAVMLLKIGNQKSVLCLRGKCECPNEFIDLNKAYGFEAECMKKYKEQGSEVFKLITGAYNHFSVFARVNSMLFSGGNMPLPCMLNEFDALLKSNPTVPFVATPCIQSSIWNSYCTKSSDFEGTEYMFPIPCNGKCVIPAKIPLKCLEMFLQNSNAECMIVATDDPRNGLVNIGRCVGITTGLHDGPKALNHGSYLMVITGLNGNKVVVQFKEVKF